jgi:hypothetical protein
MSKSIIQGTTPYQHPLDLQIATEREVNGVQMGVLADGTPYLALRGPARMCGVEHSQIVRMTAAWLDSPLKPREQKIREVSRRGRLYRVLCSEPLWDDPSHVPPSVCMAVLEYYAFEAKGVDGTHAANSYRLLARKGFEAFIYSQVGYNPSGALILHGSNFMIASRSHITRSRIYISVFLRSLPISR